MVEDADEGWFEGVLAGAQGGDPGAFDALVRWLERPLLGFLRARRVPDAEDLANEVLVRVFTGIGRFEGNAPQFRAWVFRIARNLIVDEHRRAQRAGVVELTPTGELPELGHVLADSGFEQRERIEAMLASLTPEQQEVLVLRVVAGLSVEETAAVVGRRAGAVRALQHRALTALREKISRRA